MPQTKMTLKDLSIEVDKLKQLNGEKDILLKALEEKFNSLQNWAQELYLSFCNKINESDQIHVTNAKVLNTKVAETEEKLKELVEKKKVGTNTNAEIVEFKCTECSTIFDKKVLLKHHITGPIPKRLTVINAINILISIGNLKSIRITCILKKDHLIAALVIKLLY